MYEGIEFKERKKIMTKTHISAVARNLFAKKGFDNVTVLEIAKKSNLSVKTLFTYFSSKEALVFGVESRFIEKAQRTILDWNEKSSLASLTRELIYNMYLADSNYIISKNEFEDIIKYDSNHKIIRHLLLVWYRYELDISNILEEKLNLNENDPRLYLMASTFMLPFRMAIIFRDKNNRALDLKKQEDILWLEEIFRYMEKIL